MIGKSVVLRVKEGAVRGRGRVVQGRAHPGRGRSCIHREGAHPLCVLVLVGIWSGHMRDGGARGRRRWRQRQRAYLQRRAASLLARDGHDVVVQLRSVA